MKSTIFVKRNKFRYNKIGENMLSIEKSEYSIYEIQKSKFITTLYRIDSLEEIETNLQAIKEKYNDANHHCYAYIINDQKKASDDGEPSKTAGLPILNVLEGRNLDECACIVTRYFGGIKLGAGGLTRAYREACKKAIDCADLYDYQTIKRYNIKLDYALSPQFENFLYSKGVKIEDITYLDNEASYTYLCNEDYEKEILNITRGKAPLSLKPQVAIIRVIK